MPPQHEAAGAALHRGPTSVEIITIRASLNWRPSGFAASNASRWGTGMLTTIESGTVLCRSASACSHPSASATTELHARFDERLRGLSHQPVIVNQQHPVTHVHPWS